MKSNLLLLLLCCITTVFTQPVGEPVMVDLPFGSIRGYSNGETWQFYGIPFAAPPIGDLRWQPPTNFAHWNGSVLDARNPPPACIQNCTLSPFGCASNTSEDCLYLNIFIPLSWTPGSNNSYNVLLFIYGGAFTEGTSGCLLYDSKFFTSFTNSIIVTFNYRVGVLGFLRNYLHGIHGNMGFRDQRMAMQWVKNYISYFGGSGKTTLFGESAGAISVGAHIASPLSKGLFDNVIIESDPWTLPFRSKSNADLLGGQFFIKLGCNTKSCAFNKSAHEVLEAQMSLHIPWTITSNILEELFVWTPIIDNIDLMDQPFVTLIEMAKISTMPPAIMGTTTDEGYLFVKGINLLFPNKEEVLYYGMLLDLFPFHFEKVVKTYNSLFGTPVSPDDYVERLSMIAGDYLFRCPTRHLLATISESKQSTWGYLWNRGILYNDSSTFCYKRPCHGTELVYVFGTVTLWGQQFILADHSLSSQVQTYWSNMAESSNPNNSPGVTGVYPAWTSYTTGTGAQMFFDIPIGHMSHHYRDSVCDLLDSIGYDRSDVFSSSDDISDVAYTDEHPKEEL